MVIIYDTLTVCKKIKFVVELCFRWTQLVRPISSGTKFTCFQLDSPFFHLENVITTNFLLLFCNANSDVDFDVKPFSQRKRVQPSELAGSWKVFETSATPIYGEETITEENNDPPYVYLCTETLKKRNLPESAVYFGEEEVLDMVDITMLWLPGGVTSYVDVNEDGVLCIGVGWYSDEGINLVMERDYGTDGKLKEVRSKTEVKRRWSEPPPV